MIDTVLLGSAASIGFVHTLLGVDHSLPFVALGRAQGWSLRRTLAVTFGCGVAHVLSSVLLGVIGIGLGFAIEDLVGIESARGDLVAYALIAFGLTYATWATVKALRGQSHTHAHVHADGSVHDHQHDHEREHLHAHEAPKPDGSGARQATFWTLFLIFAFGPCEALIPVLMAPAWTHNAAFVAAVVGLFGAVTLATMMGTVAAVWRGLDLAKLRRLGIERWANPVAGAVVASSGGLILLGL